MYISRRKTNDFEAIRRIRRKPASSSGGGASVQYISKTEREVSSSEILVGICPWVRCRIKAGSSDHAYDSFLVL